jgi:hypothetical protein
MNLHKEGYKSIGICSKCQSMVYITFKRKNYKLKSGRIVYNVLLGICDVCDGLVSIPQQPKKVDIVA